MDLRDMECFCAIVEEGQISKAARRLNMSQPPLSLRLKEMESEIGCQLINRSMGQWKITAAGQALYDECQRILAHASGLAETVRNSLDNVQGIVRIGIGSHCTSFFKNIVPELLEKYPRISCRTIVTDSPTIEQHLQERSVELAVLRLNLEKDNCAIYNLPKQRMVAVYSPLLGAGPAGETVSFEELARYPLLLSRRWANADGFRPIVAAFQAKRIRPRIVVDTQMPGLLLDLLQTCPAVAIMPDTEIPPAGHKELVVRVIDHYVVFQPVIAHLKDVYLTPQANIVLQLLKKQTAED